MPKKTKAELRALRQADKQRKARARQDPDLPAPLEKTTSYVKYIESDKITSHAYSKGSVYDCAIVINHELADRSGSWSWGERNWDADTDSLLMEFFSQLGDVTWKSVYQEQKHHGDRPTTSFCPEARARWSELGNEQFDTVFRFRLSGPCRLIGIRWMDVFHTTWYDPDHKIIPSIKKHT